MAAALVIIVAAALVLGHSSGGDKGASSVQSADTSTTTSPGTASATGTTPPGTSAHPDAMFSSPADGSIIDAVTAAKVTAAWWTVRFPAWKAHDEMKLATVEAGATLQADAVECMQACTANLEGSGERSYSIPPQTTYPARFLAQLHFVGSSGGQTGYQNYFVVFTRQSPNDPWLAVNLSGNGSAQGVLAATTQGGGVTDDVPTLSGALDAATLPNALADYFQSYKATGEPPASSPLQDNGGLHDTAASQYSLALKYPGYGVEDHTDYRGSAAEDGFYTFATGTGDLLACSAIRWDTTLLPASGRQMFTVPSGPNSIFNALLSPGDYRKVEQIGVRQACWTVTPSCDCVVTLSLNGHTYKVTTDPS